jgi:hypothetical protein
MNLITEEIDLIRTRSLNNSIISGMLNGVLIYYQE